MTVSPVILCSLLIIGSEVAAAIMLPRSVLRRYVALDLALYALIAVLWRLAELQDLSIWPPLLFALLLVSRLALLFGTAAAADVAPQVRWSPVVAATLAAAIYLLILPDQLRRPPDGDEPYYLLNAISMIEDGDLDLQNQHIADRGRDFGRPALGRGPRLEPFFSVLLIPGYYFGQFTGACLTVILFAALLVFSLWRLFENEGISKQASLLLFPLIACGPPVIFYATRVWPEIPGAFFFAESLRAYRRLTAPADERAGALRFGSGTAGAAAGGWFWFGACLLAMSLLKLRFVLIAVVLLVLCWRELRDRRFALLALTVIGAPLVVSWLATSSPFNVHDPLLALPRELGRFVTGTAGIALDAQFGLLFQAPVYAFALIAGCSRQLSPVVKAALLSTSLYLLLLVPRFEWYGGWAPPLRYLVIFVPAGALYLAACSKSRRPAALLLAAAVSAALVVHGLAFPLQLYHVATGESVVGAMLSRQHAIDFSRFLPSLVRPNAAALWWSIIVVALALISRIQRRSNLECGSSLPLSPGGLPPQSRDEVTLSASADRSEDLTASPAPAAASRGYGKREQAPALQTYAAVAVLTVALAAIVVAAHRPGSVVHLEDAHVQHSGGELEPRPFTIARFRFTGGWRMWSGDRVTFRFPDSRGVLYYNSHAPAIIRTAAGEYVLPSSGGKYRRVTIELGASARKSIECASGLLTLDRIVRE